MAIFGLLYIVALFLLAGALCLIDFSNRVQRAFALLLFFLAMLSLCTAGASVNPANAMFWTNLRGYFALAIWTALADFVLLYFFRNVARLPLLRAANWVIGLALQVAYLLNHSLLFTFDGMGRFQTGSLGVFYDGFFAAMAGTAVALAWSGSREGENPRGRFDRLLSLAFATTALATGAVYWAFVFTSGWRSIGEIGDTPSILGALAALPLAFGAVAILLRHSIKTRRHAATAWIVGLASFSFGVTAVSFVWDNADLWFVVTLYVSRLLFPLIVAYGVVRMNAAGIDPFRLDISARTTIRRGTIGGVVVALFFIISEGSANILQEIAATQDLDPAWAQAFGILGAGLLVFALTPMQRWGDRVAGSVLPHARPLDQLTILERQRLFGEQAAIAWADGSITRKERLLLDALREKLALPAAEAARLESRAARVPGV